jgi:hypothetical protein
VIVDERDFGSSKLLKHMRPPHSHDDAQIENLRHGASNQRSSETFQAHTRCIDAPAYRRKSEDAYQKLGARLSSSRGFVSVRRGA